ncbi:exonuclease domain-containing protein [Parasediminibacterium sp. JCM 36343]|uniref:exonuclease domain-containing protein n=1 Tax=Parasediminibacterium sp. JCM 36343 TaxID=3374279 RepID=UPI00397906A8
MSIKIVSSTKKRRDNLKKVFAIVDIETTGGHAGANNITEIAIVLHNGQEIEGKYTTLINPCMPIQKYVQGLTGITDAMVAQAPKFDELAENIFNLLKDRVFVAHNVNFDYSFVKHELALAGFDLDTHKLCTIRLTKKIFPNLPKYGLGTVCRELNIMVNDRHRASGDALATAELFSLLIKHDTSGELAVMIKKKANRYLPPHVDVETVENLPMVPGVYYFHDKAGKVVYVGKAKNLKKRVTSHFSNNKPSKQKQDFLREIHGINYTVCDSELIASLLESIEIKRLWPIFNKSQKHYEHQYGIFMFEDARGYMRLGIDKKRKLLQPLITFSLFADAHSTLWQWARQHELHPALCFLDNSEKVASNLPDVASHNAAIEKVLASAQEERKTYLIKEPAQNYILIENGKFYGMGKIEDERLVTKPHELKTLLTPFPENEVIRGMLRKYTERYPGKVVMLG